MEGCPLGPRPAYGVVLVSWQERQGPQRSPVLGQAGDAAPRPPSRTTRGTWAGAGKTGQGPGLSLPVASSCVLLALLTGPEPSSGGSHFRVPGVPGGLGSAGSQVGWLHMEAEGATLGAGLLPDLLPGSPLSAVARTVLLSPFYRWRD